MSEDVIASMRQRCAAFGDELAKVRLDVDKWIASQTQNLEGTRKEHSKILKESEETIKHLASQEQDLINKAKILEQILEREHAEEDALSTQVSQLQLHEQNFPEKIRQMQQQIAALNAEYQQLLKQVEQNQQRRSSELTRASRGLDTFRDRLGLVIEKDEADGRLNFIFTKIDPTNPTRCFSFSVFIDAQDQYQVENCEPVLSEGRLRELTNELNQTNHFSRFVKRMRDEFRGLCSLH